MGRDKSRPVRRRRPFGRASEDLLRHAGRRGEGGGRRVLRPEPRRHPRHRRRVRFGQERHRPVDHEAGRHAAGPLRKRAGGSGRDRSPVAERKGARRDTRQAHLDDFSEPARRAQPCLYRLDADGGDPSPPRPFALEGGGGQARRSPVTRGGFSRSRACCRQLSPSDERRHVPAGGRGAQHGLRAGSADRRRADDRPRRSGAGDDSSSPEARACGARVSRSS